MQSFEGLLVHDDAGGGRAQGEGACRAAGALQARELVGRDVPVLEPRAVKLGARAGGYAAVLDGVREGEKVVTGANFLIDAESNLRAALQAFTAPEGKSP